MSRGGGGTRLGAVEFVSVSAVRLGTSIRLSGEDIEHVRTLVRSSADMPPIVVHRSTMRVIDGVHRLRAARLRGQQQIQVQYFDGTDEEAFFFAVRANLNHGLPLTTADRRAAASRIIAVRPDWSDRRVGAAAGLAGTTVAALRPRIGPVPVPNEARVGLDGRVRPLDGCARRQLAVQLIKEKPDASVREIARTAGLSPSTALDVRDRLRRGDDPVPPRIRRQDKEKPAPTAGDDAIMAVLRKDPTLRFTDGGRFLLRLLETHITAAEALTRHVGAVPVHCTKLVADLARNAGRRWFDFADQLEAGHRIAQ
jgi:hypothetical protein